jgi:hypothetical protein
MQRVALACAGFALAIIASPVVAQTTPEQQPVPAPQAEPAPPPLPPMPSARHRWVDTGSHHAASSHHQATRPRQHASTKQHASHKHATKHKHQAAHERHPTVHASKQSIRKCHGMSYRQILRDSTCRAVMRQDLEAAEPRHHVKAHRHSSAHRHVTVHHQVTTKHRRSTRHHGS